MKKFLVGMIGIGVGVGLFAAVSVLYAGEPEPQKSEEGVYQQKVDEFHVVLLGKPGATIYEENVGGDAVYQKAHDAVETYVDKYGEDGSAELVKLLEARREVALSLYEQHFGPWQGTPSEFDEFLERADDSFVDRCAKSAAETCGRGQVCWVKAAGAESCTFACRDSSGNCPAIPASQ